MALLSLMDSQSMADPSLLGVDIEYTWIDEILKALIVGGPTVQVDAASPYAANSIDEDGCVNVRWEALPNDEKAGVMIAAMMRDVFVDCKNFRLALLLDDFHGKSHEQPLTELQQDEYIVQMARLLFRSGVLLPNDVPGREYVMTRERDLKPLVDQLINKLRFVGRGELEHRDNGDIVFYPHPVLIRCLALDSDNRKRELARNGVLLMRNGRPTCAALDASNYLNNAGVDTMYLVVLDKQMKSQQDKAYALLRAIGVVTQERYDNVFYDAENMTASFIAYSFCHLIEAHLTKLLELNRIYADWLEESLCGIAV